VREKAHKFKIFELRRRQLATTWHTGMREVELLRNGERLCPGCLKSFSTVQLQRHIQQPKSQCHWVFVEQRTRGSNISAAPAAIVLTDVELVDRRNEVAATAAHTQMAGLEHLDGDDDRDQEQDGPSNAPDQAGCEFVVRLRSGSSLIF
jgi:hypothetical protein